MATENPRHESTETTPEQQAAESCAKLHSSQNAHRVEECHEWLDENATNAVPYDKVSGLDELVKHLMRDECVLLLSGKNPAEHLESVAARKNAVPLPGYRLASVAQLCLSRRAFNLYVAPVIADIQEEYIDAIAAGDKWRGRWIAARGYLLVIPGWLYASLAAKLEAFL